MGRGVGRKTSWELKIKNLKLKMVEDNDKEISQENRKTKTNNGYRVSTLQNEEFWDCCIKIPINDLTDWAVHLKMLKMRNFTLHIFTIENKNKTHQPKATRKQKKKNENINPEI